MTVLLPNATLTCHIRSTPAEKDAHGRRVGGSGFSETRGPASGAVTVPYDGSFSPNQWTLRVDPKMWPLKVTDEISDDQGRRFVVRYARLHAVPGASDADYIRVAADLDPPKTL